MEVVNPRCCGLDVHKKTVVACVITPQGKETRTFFTMTRDLLKLRDWLAGCGVTRVAMESTGVLWKPVYNLLEDEFTVDVVNAYHIKGGTWQEDRCQGCGMDSRPVAAWTCPGQLHT